MGAEGKHRPVERAFCSVVGRAFCSMGCTFPRRPTSCNLRLESECQHVDDGELLKTDACRGTRIRDRRELFSTPRACPRNNFARPQTTFIAQTQQSKRARTRHCAAAPPSPQWV